MAAEAVRVLLIEDDEDDYVLTRNLLREIEGVQYDLTWISGYDEGLDELCRDGYDACLVDYRLDVRDGISLIEEAQRRNCSAALILLTGQDERQVDLAAMKAGAADYLSKARLTASELERSIRYSIQQRRVEQQRLILAQEQTARREAESANRAKDQFLATLSHELRTPLNAILGWAQILQLGKVDPDTLHQAIDAIQRNAKAQAQLIEDLLDVSRIVSGKVRLEFVPVNIKSVVEAAIDAVKLSAESKGVHLVREFDDACAAVLGDSTRLQQIIWNLLTNAIKFTPAGGTVRVEVTCPQRDVQITVSDTGKGIEAEFLPYVFDRFRQADSSTTRTHTGLGLGLAIVRHLVELHGGSIKVESAGRGLGTTFTVSLPLANRTNSSGDSSADNERGRPDKIKKLLEGLSVLVVDDEPDARKFVSTALHLHGARVHEVGSVAEAFQACACGLPDIIVSDIAMPVEDGYSFIRRMRSQDCEHARSVPAVAVTAHATQQDREHALACGFNAHLAKPVETSHLVSVLANLARGASGV